MKPKKLHPAAELAAYKTGLLKSKTEQSDDDKYLRLAAEFDNFKRRTARQYSEMVRNANEDLILEILGVVDDFERALDSVLSNGEEKQAEEYQSMIAGMKLIYGKMMAALRTRGVELMDALNKPFDPHFHEAVMQTPSEDKDAGTVIGVVAPGYLLGGKVIRHAKVVVAA